MNQHDTVLTVVGRSDCAALWLIVRTQQLVECHDRYGTCDALLVERVDVGTGALEQQRARLWIQIVAGADQTLGKLQPVHAQQSDELSFDSRELSDLHDPIHSA